MKVKKKDLRKGEIQLVVEVESQDLLKHFKSTYEKLAKEVKISGFRPGKAPRKLSEEAIGQAKLLSQSLDLAIQSSYYQAVIDNKLVPVCPPKITIVKYPTWGLEEKEIEDNLVFGAEFEIMPTVILKDYSQVKVAKKIAAKIKESDIDTIVLHLQRQKATFAEVNRPAQKEDRAEVNYQGAIDGVKKDAMSAKNQPIVLGDKTLIPGFEENIIGMEKGQEKKFSLDFPSDYRAKEFAGKKADFSLKLVDLKEVNLPKADDQFAANFGHQTVKDLRAAIEKSLEQEIKDKTGAETESAVLEKVLPFLSVEVPESLIEQEIDRMIAGMKAQVEGRGISLEKYLESIKKTQIQLRQDLKLPAEKNVKIGFLLGKIIEAEKLDPKDKEAGKKALEILIKKVTK